VADVTAPTLPAVLSDVVRASAARFGDRPVVDGPDGVLGHASLDRHADALASALAGRGVRPGDVVAVVLPSGADWLVAATAIDRAGGVVAGVSPVLSPRERSALVELVRPALVLAHPELVDGLPLRADVAVVEPASRGASLGHSVTSSPPEVPGRDPDDPAVICFTSGTSGRPKAAWFGTRQLGAVRRIDLGPAHEHWGGGSPMLASTQFAHVGMVLKLPWYLQLGATLHVMERWRADDALELVARHRMPTIGVVAPQLALMLRSPLIERLDLSCVTSIIAGGAASPPALVEQARRIFGAAYSIRYSSTESGGVGLATSHDADEHEALHTVGRPRPGVEVRIADDRDGLVPDGAVGELQLRSAAVMSGYWDDPEETAAALSDDGWLRTGDLAVREPSGAVCPAGRRTEMYLRGGYNVFPSEVEGVLSSAPGVRDLVIVPEDDDVLGERGVALVVPADAGRPPTLEGLREFAADHLAAHKLPEDVVRIDEVPLTGAQKVDRAAAKRLLSLHRDGRAADGTG
jgi:acyl-CoA synthetase (AMP-forming)/AMP-acid ligase II